MTASRFLPRGPAIAGPAGLDRSTSLGLGRVVALSLAAALACVGGMLALRRLAGGFAVTPGPTLSWAVAIVGGMLVMATDLAARLGEESWPRWLARAGLALAAVAVMPLGAGLPWPARMLGLAAVGLALVIATPGLPPLRWPKSLGRGRRRGAAGVREPAPDPDIGVEGRIDRVVSPAVGPGGTPAASEAAGWPAAAPAGFRQRLERFEAADGADCLRGQLMLTVAAGSRMGHAHVGFCPPFNALPAVDVSTECDVVEAAVSAAEILPWGVRVECRLSEPAEESLEIPVDLRARNPA
jgi:hypothetical protein